MMQRRMYPIFFCLLLFISCIPVFALLSGCSQCRHDADCSSGGLCVDGKCEEPQKPPPVRRPTCISGETQSCYSGPAETANRGICKTGTQICTGGAWSSCQGEITPQEEKCDGIDNNCDGQVDEGCSCQDGDTQSCYTGTPGTRQKGDCRDGAQQCVNGVWDNCLNQHLPQAEVCDNQDNDCNGLIDDGVSKKCQTNCGIGEEICRNGKFEPCNVPQPTAEVCGDNKDNNCDGSVDEGCECTPNTVRNCYTGPQGTEGQGPCQNGIQACSTDGKWQDCKGQVLPKVEACNNQDDDCNGQIDDNIKRPCSRGCNSGQEFCQAGQWQGCNAAPADPEVCDGKDNDCNGKVDDLANGAQCECNVGQTEVCYTGPQNTVGVGPCLSGTRTCESTGKWSICLNQVIPAVEDCDGKDNDCDGRIDNQKGTTDLLERACYSGASGTSGKGECKDGKQTCNNGRWSGCQGQVVPKAEECNNKDDDCNGKIDDGLVEDCYSGAAGTENKGVCKKGQRTCTQGTWGACVGEVTPSPERCNQKDDDCDGQTDEDGVCDVCNAGQSQACYTGPSNTRNVSPCKDGTSQCVGGQWGACTGEVKPKNETCNNQDDNCNGQIDEGVTRSCSSSCGPGTEICQAGAWVNCDAPKPKTEVCNNQDDDCNGQIDDGIDCTILATGDWSGKVLLWNPFSFQKLRTLTHTDAVNSVVFSPNKQILGVGTIGKVSLWNPETGTSLVTMTHSGKIRGISFSPNNQYVATGSDNATAIIWQVSNGQKRFTLTHSFGVRTVVYHPNGNLLATANGTRVSFWDPNTGQLKNNQAMTYTVYSIDISSDGKSMLVGGTDSSNKPRLELWDISTATYKRTVTFTPTACQVVVYHTSFSPDGSRATAACPEAAYVWNVSTQQQVAEIKKPGTYFYSAGLSKDNKTFAVGGRVGTPGELYLFDLSTSTPTQKFYSNSDHSNYLWSLAFRP